MTRVLAIDAGTSRVRAAVVDDAPRVVAERARPAPASHPGPGRVELDARALADSVLELARAVLAEAGPVAAVGLTGQRATTVVWDRAGGEPIAPAQGWQDLRTLRRCASLRERGHAFAPNQSAPKLLDVLDAVDPARGRDLCFGTVDAWLGWVLSEGAVHVTDVSGAGATGLLGADGRWASARLADLGIPAAMLPEVAGSAEVRGAASRLPGAPPLAGRLGDQQASLLGQGCLEPGDAKLTLGTSAMLEVMIGPAPAFTGPLGPSGTFPVFAWRIGGETRFALEASELCAGGCVAWLRDLGVIEGVGESEALARACADTGGVVFVPALLGLGTPSWDYAARGAFLGLTRGSGRAELVRAVLEGVAARTAELVEAAESDAGTRIEVLRADGGMTDNAWLVQAVADACGRAVEVSPEREASALGAALAAGHGIGLWREPGALARTWRPRARVEPAGRPDRERWREAVARVRAR